MSSEPEVTTVPAETPASEGVAKPAKEKKARVPKEKKPKEAKATPSHPPYFQMIKEAIVALHDKQGSSAYAIAKYMESNHKAVLPDNYKKKLWLHLKNAAAKGKLVKVKASFKLAELPKKKALAAKKPSTPSAPKPPVSKKAPAKKSSVRKAPKKKSATPKPKAPKSIKSPAAKRARKAA